MRVGRDCFSLMIQKLLAKLLEGVDILWYDYQSASILFALSWVGFAVFQAFPVIPSQALGYV